MEMGT